MVSLRLIACLTDAADQREERGAGNELGDQRGKNEPRKRGDKFPEIYLVGGLDHFLIFPCIGNNMTNIFQRG